MRKAFALAMLLAVPNISAAAGLPFMHDNYGAALAQAKQRNLPVFVEVWAPW